MTGIVLVSTGDIQLKINHMTVLSSQLSTKHFSSLHLTRCCIVSRGVNHAAG